MKDEYMAAVKHEMELSRKYSEGYEDGCADGHDRALADIRKLKSVAAEELLRGFKCDRAI
jgi:hypothetical protein